MYPDHPPTPSCAGNLARPPCPENSSLRSRYARHNATGFVERLSRSGDAREGHNLAPVANHLVGVWTSESIPKEYMSLWEGRTGPAGGSALWDALQAAVREHAGCSAGHAPPRARNTGRARGRWRARLLEDVLTRRIATGPAAAAFGMSEPPAGLLVPVPGPGGRQGRLEAGIDPAVLDVDPGRAQR